MSKILKIEDAKVVSENGKKITRYVFNNDKIVRVDNKTDEVITKNVPKRYLDLISIYSAHAGLSEENEIDFEDDFSDDEEYIEEKKEKGKAKKPRGKYPKEEDERYAKIEEIRSGKGAGLGVFLGIILRFTIIGPIIAGFCSFSFLNDISDEGYLTREDSRDINFRKGFYAFAFFGIIVGIVSCSQWKTDMISVLEGEPNKYSKNRHSCFKVWFWIILVYYILSFVTGFIRGYNEARRTTTTIVRPYTRY